MINQSIIDWLLESDVSILYLVHRDLLSSSTKNITDLKHRISNEGFGKQYLDLQHPDGHWGLSFYQPKWTSTHYTLLELRNICLNVTPSIRKSIAFILDHHIGNDGGINPSGGKTQSDICINGMFLNYASYFSTPSKRLEPIVDLIIHLHMKDGGYNCRLNRSGAKHSSVHSTICVLEGIRTYFEMGYTYRINELLSQEKQAQEFLLMHHLYKSDRTGEIIHKGMTSLSYPSRWKYNFLRALYYFTKCDLPYDNRMDDAMDLLMSKRLKNGTWPHQANHPGKVHFIMEESRKPSPFNTYMALKVLTHYNIPF